MVLVWDLPHLVDEVRKREVEYHRALSNAETPPPQLRVMGKEFDRARSAPNPRPALCGAHA